MGLDIRINDGELRTAVSSLLRIDAALSEMPRLTDDTANAVGDATLARAVKEFTDSWRVKREDIITMVRAHRTALEAILKWSDAVDSIGGRSPGGVLGEAVSRSVEETRRRIEQNLGGSGQEDLDGIEQIPVTPLERPSRVPPMVPPLHDLGSFHTLPAPVTRPTASSASEQGPALVAPDVDAALQAVDGDLVQMVFELQDGQGGHVNISHEKILHHMRVTRGTFRRGVSRNLGSSRRWVVVPVCVVADDES